MLGHLLKHEFRATGRRMLPTLGVLALLGLLANLSIRLLESGVGDGTVLRILLVLFVVAFFVGITVAWIMTLVLMISRFYRNLLKDEGYLMFTLPANTHELIWSKLIVSTVWFLATGLLTGLLMFLTIANLVNLSGDDLNNMFIGLGEALDVLRDMGVTNGSLVLLLVELLAATVLACLTTSLQFYAAMGLGQMSATRKGLWSVLAFIGLSIAFQIISSAVLGGMSNTDSMDLVVNSFETMVQTAPGTVRAANSGIGITMLYELLQGAVLYVITSLSLSRKLNLA